MLRSMTITAALAGVLSLSSPVSAQTNPGQPTQRPPTPDPTQPPPTDPMPPVPRPVPDPEGTTGELERAQEARLAEAFAREAAQGGLMEVELGRHAVANAQHPEVKRFGQRMIDDHSKANTELQAIAGRHSWSLPTELDDDHKEDVERLTKLSGAEFDRAYMDMMVEDHRRDVKEFERASRDTGRGEIAQWAAKTVPVLREHLKLAESIHDTLGKGPVGTSGKH